MNLLCVTRANARCHPPTQVDGRELQGAVPYLDLANHQPKAPTSHGVNFLNCNHDGGGSNSSGSGSGGERSASSGSASSSGGGGDGDGSDSGNGGRSSSSNCGGGGISTASCTSHGAFFELSSAEAFSPGQEVFISYGEKDNRWGPWSLTCGRWQQCYGME